MKSTYIFFLLVCLALSNFGRTSASLNKTAIGTFVYSMNNGDWIVTEEETLTSKFKGIIEYADDQKTRKINHSRASFIEPSYKIQQQKELNSDSRLKIRLEFSTSTNFKRELLLTIDERTTDGIDKGFDALLIEEFPNDMYWMIGDSKLVIQAINDLPEDKVIPIGITSMGDGSLQVKVASIENPYPDMEVYLRDNNSMKTFDIRNRIFEATLKKGQYNDKYALVFKPYVEIIDDNEEPVKQLLVFVGEFNQLLKIRKPEEMEIFNVSVYNLIGQQVSTLSADLNTSKIDFPIQLETGIYVVNFETNKGIVQKKIIIR